MVKYCPNCGTEVTEVDKYCNSCGKSLAVNCRFDESAHHYTLFTTTMKDLQPVAFFISALLVLAVFLKDDPLHQKYALFASVLFFLAYLGLAVYNISKKKILLYWGFFLIVFGVDYIYKSFGGIVSIISDVDDKYFQFIIKSIIVSIVIVFTKLLLDASNENTLSKISKIFFWIASPFTLIFIYANIYFDVTINWFYFAFLLLIVCTVLSSFNINFNHLKSWLEKK